MVSRWPQVPFCRPRPKSVGQSEHEIGLAHLLARGADGIGRGEAPVEVHVTAAAIVAGVEHVHLLAQNVGAHFHHVAAANHGEVVRVVVGGGGEQLLRADVGVAQAGGIGEAREGKQPGAGSSACPVCWQCRPSPLSAPPLFSMRLFTPTRASFTRRGLMVRVQLITPFWNGAMLKLL